MVATSSISSSLTMILLLWCGSTWLTLSVVTALVVPPLPRAAVPVFHRGRTTFLLRHATTPNKDGEEMLREQIAQKNAQLDPKNEARYAVLEGSDMTVDVDEGGDEANQEEAATATVAVATTPPTQASPPPNGQDATATVSPRPETAWERKLKRLTRPRPYPLFLLEKAANIVDDVVDDLTQASQHLDVQIGSSTVVKDDATNAGVNGSTTTVKEKVVILGCGWGAAAFLKGVDASRFDVTVISPRNFFLFTPMLAGASVGTVEYRSITEPVREINPQADYLEATATSVDVAQRQVECQSVVCDGNNCAIQDFAVSYDRLIVTVGAQTNTFGIPGVREHCCFLKSVEDARRIRTAIVNLFERANLPNLTDDQRRNVLTFCVIGAGPTGVEFASELRDFCEQDGPKYYPQLLQHVRIKVVEASSSVLAPFDKSLQTAAVQQLTRAVDVRDPAVANSLPARFELTELLLDSGVREVTEDVVRLHNGQDIPYGLAVWAAGNGPLPITLQLIDELEEAQTPHQPVARGRIAVDPWLRAYGSDGRILALGDCSCNPDGPLPATAQVASQQGEYLARIMNSCEPHTAYDEDDSGVLLLPPKYRTEETTTDAASSSTTTTKKHLADYVTGLAMNDYEYAAPFQFLNLGILAYTGGGSALAQLQVAPGEKGSVKGKGKIGFGLWRSVYLSKQVSWRNRILVLTDWLKAQVFGRDITRA